MVSKKLNGINYSANIALHEFFMKTNSGARWFYLNKFQKRFEINIHEKLNKPDWKARVFFELMAAIFPTRGVLKNQVLMNIFLLDLIYSYRGWRHLNNLPTRGQRTWSNASSVKSNLILKNYKTKLARKFYGKFLTPQVQIATKAEYINTYWKLQWTKEWFFSRAAMKKRLKKEKHRFHIDLVATSKGLLGNLRRHNPKIGKKKKNY